MKEHSLKQTEVPIEAEHESVPETITTTENAIMEIDFPQPTKTGLKDASTDTESEMVVYALRHIKKFFRQRHEEHRFEREHLVDQHQTTDVYTWTNTKHNTLNNIQEIDFNVCLLIEPSIN